MSRSLSCPRCGSANIKQVCRCVPVHEHVYAEDAHWDCQNCGETCHDPAKSPAISPTLDITVGFTVLASLVLMIISCLH
jgi:hypothetical protein